MKVTRTCKARGGRMLSTETSPTGYLQRRAANARRQQQQSQVRLEGDGRADDRAVYREVHLSR